MRAGQFQSFDVTLDLAQQVCEAHALPRPVAVHRAARGEVSAVFAIDLEDGQGAVLKVYLRNQDHQLLVAENEVLGHLRRHSSVPVPSWSELCLEGGVLGQPYALHERLRGENGEVLLGRLSLPEGERLLRRVGELAAQVHHITLQGNGLRRAKVRPAATWLSDLEQEFRRGLEHLQQEDWLNPALVQRAREVWEVGRSVRDLPFEPVLCHGDFQLWNLLVDPATLTVTGLLDVGDAYQGPPAADFRDLELNLFISHPHLRRAFLHGYGWDDFDEGERERLRQAALSRALSLMAAYWGPTPHIQPATVWHLLAPWSEDAEG